MLKTSGKNTKDYRKVFLAYIEPLKKKRSFPEILLICKDNHMMQTVSAVSFYSVVCFFDSE